ncbi:SOS mutagenesis and repair, UmuD protein homolog [Calothrix parasitica NIES-267]|uniref:SOS mutagenesis and repair, UmuD protein homolog n=1 Tax=Calothrix parasitica NIES-267 TaxID=1973488 RepID=A0A1Z4LZN4_9CYAN|nr:SOS mutagenesis and repair, UmuD protein homolog [Calothrix parasitica NIES-267]
MSAGFPSPAQDYLDGKLDLNSYLIKHPAATFFMRMTGDAMIDAGIFDNDLLIVDRSIKPQNNSIVIAVLNGELTVRKIINNQKGIYLKSNLKENSKENNLEVTEDIDFSIWGVVTKVIHELHR